VIPGPGTHPGTTSWEVVDGRRRYRVAESAVDRRQNTR
jgi:ParB-like chromosome segregation protein Spo0J